MMPSSEADEAVEREVQDKIVEAEAGEFGGITDIILRGDGHLLVGRSSQDEDAQQFLDRVPAILVRPSYTSRGHARGKRPREKSLGEKFKCCHRRI